MRCSSLDSSMNIFARTVRVQLCTSERMQSVLRAPGAHSGSKCVVIAVSAPLIYLHFVYLLDCIFQFVNLQVLRQEVSKIAALKSKTCKLATRQGKISHNDRRLRLDYHGYYGGKLS